MINIAPFDIRLTPHFPNKLGKNPFFGVRKKFKRLTMQIEIRVT